VTIFDPSKTKVDLTHGVVSAAALTPVSGLGKSAAYGSPELNVLLGSRALVVESFGSTPASDRVRGWCHPDRLLATGSVDAVTALSRRPLPVRS
jgi:hypothetical protein